MAVWRESEPLVLASQSRVRQLLLGRLLCDIVSGARMSMRELSEDVIGVYLDAAGDAASASVGAYQLEGLGIHLFSRIEGDHFTILGLPLLPLLAYLRSQGLLSL